MKRPGSADASEEAPSEQADAWWDAIFRLRATGLTYAEMAARGHKHSARDMAISRFLFERVYYRRHIDLSQTPRTPTRTISWSSSRKTVMRRSPPSTWSMDP